jgi:hypothetical protein
MAPMLVSLPQATRPTPVAGSRQPVPPPPQPYPYPSQPPVAPDVVVEDALAILDPDAVAAIAPHLALLWWIGRRRLPAARD